MEEQTNPTIDPPAPAIAVPEVAQAGAVEATASMPETAAFSELQPTIEEIPYHTPPAQGGPEATIAQAVKQAGPITPISEPAPVEQTPVRHTNRAAIAIVAIAAVCVCAVTALGLSHKL